MPTGGVGDKQPNALVKSVYTFKGGREGRTEGEWLYLVLSDDPVGLRRLPPLQDDLLLIGAALDGLQRNCTRNCRRHSEAGLSAELQLSPLGLHKEPQTTCSSAVTGSQVRALPPSKWDLWCRQTNQYKSLFHKEWQCWVIGPWAQVKHLNSSWWHYFKSLSV